MGYHPVALIAPMALPCKLRAVLGSSNDRRISFYCFGTERRFRKNLRFNFEGIFNLRSTIRREAYAFFRLRPLLKHTPPFLYNLGAMGFFLQRVIADVSRNKSCRELFKPHCCRFEVASFLGRRQKQIKVSITRNNRIDIVPRRYNMKLGILRQSCRLRRLRRTPKPD